MTEQEARDIVEHNPKIVAEMVEFWVWVQGLNKGLKWLALIGLPLAVAIWSILHWFKNN